jgi:GT2 family glycosyltransferase
MNQVSFTSLIVTYNSASEIANLLDDLHSHIPDNKVIVIDNASQDETVDVVQKHFPQVHLIQNTLNVGYAKAVNQGFELCNSEYVLLVNPDIRITSPKIFLELEKCLKQFQQVAVAAPLQFKDDEDKRHLTFTWSYCDMESFRFYLSFLLQRNQVLTEPIRVTFLNAGCLFIRRSVFEQVGRLNEKYFLYGEEPDLFLKLKRYGFECYLLPHIGVTHYRERSLRTRPTLQRLQLRFYAARNVADALINGWANLLLDKLAVKKSRPVSGKQRATYRKRIPNNLSH